MSNALHTSTTTLYDLAHELLSTVEQTLLDNSLALPGHRFVSFHAPAWDCCDHLVTHIAAIRPSRATIRRQRREVISRVAIMETDLVVTYIGCAAVGDPIPSDADIDANAQSMYQYAWVIEQGVVCFFEANSLTADYGACTLIKVAPMALHPPMGGCEAVTITSTVQLS